jgi:hypothetical protein
MQMKLIALCLLFVFFAAPALAGPQSGSQDNQTAPIGKKNMVNKKKKPKPSPDTALWLPSSSIAFALPGGG